MSTIVTGRITALFRQKSSVSGNPRFSITLDTGQVYKTEPDANFVYGLDSTEYLGRYGYAPPIVTLTINGRGNVESVETEAEKTIRNSL